MVDRFNFFFTHNFCYSPTKYRLYLNTLRKLDLEKKNYLHFFFEASHLRWLYDLYAPLYTRTTHTLLVQTYNYTQIRRSRAFRDHCGMKGI